MESQNLEIQNAPTNAETAKTASTASPPVQSYLNNDGIDSMTPAARKKRVSSLSLSDQWAGSMRSPSLAALSKLSNGNSNVSLKKTGSKASLGKSHSRLSMLSLGSDGHPVRYKTHIVDHFRVASYAFAFDIDGVIVKGPETIPYAREAIKMLNGENKYNIKVPYIFVTNGGGRPESERAKELSERLGVEITEDQIIQGHTPMKDLVAVYNNVLVVGGVGDKCRKVAEGYGFKNVYIPLDVMYWNPSVTPYYTLTEEDKKVCKKDVDFSKIKIDAILVFADSRNWAADQQIILELLMSKNGVMGTVSETFEEGPPIYFAHSDFIWATNYKLSRYGMGALQVSIAALYREHTGKELKVTRFGKPQRGTFKFAEKVLKNWRQDVLEEHVEEIASAVASEYSGEDGEEEEEALSFKTPAQKADEQKKEEKDKGGKQKTEPKRGVFNETDSEDSDDEDEGLTIQKLSQLTLDLPPASTVYFVGDTPESDIRFANSHDESWHSILVKTGVYQEGTVPKYKPKYTCDNVLEAVKYAIEREHQLELEEWNAGAQDPPENPDTVQPTQDALLVEREVIKEK
ncbi:hypothetical protein KL905_002987 [Ogataea polymorpha]|uniref:uncharacterized protein n=1 Tax=Ogataea polymorpha TaxID=460523 RepID=UPI0007F53F61|nr:uncharacterized protein OGAPODRAFT_92290 [Ogataea polymorpha]KAG7904840.1 hypothetical protein KL907_003056 [Ogataea polymorpha]KAG7908039.1 hypothetical protein KL906_003456 [Ogataea polymorpha]KAG7916622.1 hypothetical protein KL927_003261 [Ogataea polymorpha]KAG7921529.1 hypothetical protein KL905_002987 [Ogataea polymorpha]KAG7933909.1 hypothetical protein KL934_002831 [Ogataea polymorpha]